MVSTQTISMSSHNAMKSNYLSALRSTEQSEQGHISSPESHAAEPDAAYTLDMSDLLLPASALESELFGIPPESSATVVSSASSSDCDSSTAPVAEITTTTKKRKSSSSSERRHSLPSSLMLAQSPLGEAVTQPVPEFLCHLFSMLRDPSYSDLLAWSVPSSDEPDHMGGGIKGIGKIVVHQPESLQDFVLGKYYRHSKYASFQRQLNYFGFKKRLHGGKKGKLSPCSYIHESLTEDVGSLFTLKRRPPAKKRTVSENVVVEGESASASVSVCSATEDTKSINTAKSSSSKRRRVTVDKPPKKVSKKDRSEKKEKRNKNKLKGNKSIGKVLPPAPLRVTAEEYAPPTPMSSSTIACNQFQPLNAVAPVPVSPMPAPAAMPAPSAVPSQQPLTGSLASNEAAQPTLLELLSTSLPPSDILFSDDVSSCDDQGVPAWVTDDGQYHYHNVDSSLIDLAMLY